MAEASESKDFREHTKVLNGTRGGIMSCTRCGMDIEVGQRYRMEAGGMHVNCPKRRR
jgi:hypothetical protein